MSSTNDVRSLGATQIAVGLSALIAVRPGAFQVASTMKIVAGSGTLWIAPMIGNSLSGSSAGALIATGYPLGASEIFSLGGPATFFLSAASATMTVAVAFGYTTGATLIA
jgi:hypothetical protein